MVGQKMPWLGIGLAAAFWMADSIVNALAYREGSLPDQLLAPDPRELLLRSVISLVLVALGGYAQWAITKRRRAEEALRETEARYHHFFQNTRDLFYRATLDGTITEISPSVERYGYTREQLIGTSVLDIYEDPAERAVFVETMMRQGKVIDYELRFKAGDGRVVDVALSTRFLRGPDGTPAGFEGIIKDFTGRKRMEEALLKQIRRDPLTGVLNHAVIVQELRSLLAEGNGAAEHAVAMVDVDGLKAVNDVYGHQVGDAVLLAVAKALSQDGALVGRYGGDEFVAVLRDTDRETAERYRTAALDAFASAHLADPETGMHVPVVASIGLAIYPEEAETIDDLIRLSDSAMHATRRPPAGPADATARRPLAEDRAAEMVGQIVPLLTSPGDLKDKLRLVSHRLSVGAGYDAVDLALLAPEPAAPLLHSAHARGPEDLIEAWNREQRADYSEPHPVRLLFQRAPRAVILDDPWSDELLREPQRAILRAAGLRSVLIAPMLWQDDLIGTLSVASRRPGAFNARDARFLTAVATQVTAITRMATLLEELQSSSTRLEQAQEETVMLLAAAAEAHDQTTGRHLQGVRAVTQALAKELGHSDEDAREMGLAAVLHDIGKIRVPDAVLARAGQLSEEEWELLKHHTTWGAQFLGGRPGFELATTIARSHHERWDGGGYPDGLSGEAIPKPATIVAVADSLDAMISDRPYRKRRSLLEAVREVSACSGGQFSPEVVQALRRLHRRRRLPSASPRSAREAA